MIEEKWTEAQGSSEQYQMVKIHVIGVPGEESENGKEKHLKKKMAETFSYLLKA